MAIDTLDKLIAALPGQGAHFRKSSMTGEGAGTYLSLWKATGKPGAGATPATGNGAVPTDATAGALPFTNPGGGSLGYLGRLSAASSVAATLILYDRLWHNSGFVGNDTAAQTIGTPPTLTRPDANGANVELWGEVYTAMGATGSTFTATYTDQDGNTGQSATYVQPANALSVGQMFPFDLAAGDTGVRTVSQVQLSASTGTAGDFGLVLLRRIASIPMVVANGEGFKDWAALGLPRIYDDACLAMMLLCSSSTTGEVQGELGLVQG